MFMQPPNSRPRVLEIHCTEIKGGGEGEVSITLGFCTALSFADIFFHSPKEATSFSDMLYPAFLHPILQRDKQIDNFFFLFAHICL